MSIPSKEKVISEIENHFKAKVYPLAGKRICYTGRLSTNKTLMVLTPQSKLYPDGRWWIDLTVIQKTILNKANYSLLAFRLEGKETYYLDFCLLNPYLTNETIIYNEHEGDHWKLYIWPNEIQIIGNERRFQIPPHKLGDLVVPEN